MIASRNGWLAVGLGVEVLSIMFARAAAFAVPPSAFASSGAGL